MKDVSGYLTIKLTLAVPDDAPDTLSKLADADPVIDEALERLGVEAHQNLSYEDIGNIVAVDSVLEKIED